MVNGRTVGATALLSQRAGARSQLALQQDRTSLERQRLAQKQQRQTQQTASAQQRADDLRENRIQEFINRKLRGRSAAGIEKEIRKVGLARIAGDPKLTKAVSKAQSRRVARAPLTAGEIKSIQSGRVSTIQTSTTQKPPTGTFTAVPEAQTLIEKARREIQDLRRKGGLPAFFAGIATPAISTAEFASAVLAAPVSTIKSLPEGVRRTFQDLRSGRVARVLRQEPQFATGAVLGEILTARGVGSVGSKVVEATRIGKAAATGKLSLPSGSTVKVPSGGRTISLELISPGDLDKLPLVEQAKFAGREGIDIASGQRDFLGSILGRERIVRKPIIGEDKLSSTTKTQLKRFDEGKLTPDQAIQLDQQIKAELGVGKALIERSFFATPPTTGGRPKVRISRLGLQQQRQARLRDIIEGDITFKTERPQIILFESIDVERIPKKLRPLLNKALKGDPKALKKFEAEFLKFQLKVSGKFKPIGALSPESEFTLAPGELIRRKGSTTTTIIQGRAVPIIQTEVVKASARTKELLKKLNKGDITDLEMRTLRNRLTSESGGLDFSSPLGVRKAFVSPSSLGSAMTSKLGFSSAKISAFKSSLSKAPSSKSIGKPSVRRSPFRPSRLLRGASSRVGPSIPPRRPFSPRIGLAPPTRLLTRVPPKKIKVTKKRRLVPTKKLPGYFAFYKRRGKFIKINKKPLTKGQAQDLSSDIVDRSLANTLKIRRANAEAKKPNFNIKRGYFDKTRNKFRDFRIRKGKKIALKTTYIEKRGKPRLDTLSERQKLTAAAYVARLRKRLIKR